MYLTDFSVKEVNAYYARRGGIRTASVKGYANVGSFSGLLQRAAAQAGGAAQASKAAQTSRQHRPTGRHRPPQQRRKAGHRPIPPGRPGREPWPGRIAERQEAPPPKGP